MKSREEIEKAIQANKSNLEIADVIYKHLDTDKIKKECLFRIEVLEWVLSD